MDARILDLGDAGLTVEFGNAIDPALLARVSALDAACREAMAQGRLPGVIETVPTFRSLSLLFDPLRTGRAELRPQLEALLAQNHVESARHVRHWRFPVCFEADFAPDLPGVAAASGLSPDEVVAELVGRDYVVYMLGFLPGFPFMGDVAEALRLPRRSEPRVRVPAGSVAIAAGLTAIYPWESPGGWHLLGHCPVPLFDADNDPPALLAPGDRVRFELVSADAHARIRAELERSAWNVTKWSRP